MLLFWPGSCEGISAGEEKVKFTHTHEFRQLRRLTTLASVHSSFFYQDNATITKRIVKESPPFSYLLGRASWPVGGYMHTHIEKDLYITDRCSCLQNHLHSTLPGERRKQKQEQISQNINTQSIVF